MLNYIEINKQALLHNYRAFKSILGNRQCMCVVKANAYGHGLEQIVTLLENEADWFAVDDIFELRVLRSVSQKNTLILGYVAKENLQEVLELNASLCIYDLERAQILNTLARAKNERAKIHIKIDTFLGRQGIQVEEFGTFLEKISGLSNIHLEGVYSHFANIEDTSDRSHALSQIDAFEKVIEVLNTKNRQNILRHISASSGILVFDNEYDVPKLQTNLVRLGIGLYGLVPSQTLLTQGQKLKLQPVMRWISHIAQVKYLPENYPIGYGLTFVTPHPMKTAVIPQGFSDGYDRLLSNNGDVIIQGTRCRVLGRIMMNMFVVDVTHLEHVVAEEEVVLLGKQGQEEITAEEVARKTQTIHYEVVSRINPLLPRIIM